MHRRTLTGPNGVSFVLVALLLALAPVPVGSNRPFFWELNAVAVGLIAFLYLGFMAREPGRLRLPLAELYWPAVLGAISAAWMAVQLLPLPFDLFLPPVWSDASAALDFSLWRRISMDTAATSLMLLNYLTYGLLFFLVAEITVNDVRAHRFMQTLFAIVTAHAGIGIFLLFQLGDTMLFMQKWTYQGFATGFFVNRNSFATFLAFGLGIGSSLLVNAVLPRQRGKQNRPFREIFRLDNALIAIAGYGAGLAIIGSALLLTASRMGAFVGAVGLVMPVVLGAARAPGRRRTAFAIALVLVTVVLMVALLSAGGLTERFGSQEATQDLRWPLFVQTIGMILHRPFVGFGGGTFEDAFAIFHRLPLSADVVWDRAHNVYLELFADLGIFALGVMAAVAYVLWRTARALFGTTPSVAPVAAVTVGTIAILHSLVDFSLQIQAIELLFIAVLAAGYAQAVGSDSGERLAEPEIEVARPRAARGLEAGPFAAAARPKGPAARRMGEGSNGQ
ncbi:hypothetical protein C3941_15870 [Kaistia algarum]|uniref:O-antigen ligase family protein n=1 Tax=Kaistia algarum TaxID=2083279 RepID=UPI000CE927AC|nr:O-antigen ligase family protein [Kaistia algarum]MCX5514706.1 O-antigen ligase family protein [Kaistia algarum]PPE78869.1 hypothetical protein C3941_15870 [Kaistia algarum]